jgi:lysophospholipase L1-like esterase
MNLEQVIGKTLAISKKILVVNILPIVEKMNSSPRNGKIRLNKYMDEYNSVLQELADRFKLQLIDINSVFMKAGHEKLFIPDDGLHPNDEGHQIMFETIRPEVQEMLGWV